MSWLQLGRTCCGRILPAASTQHVIAPTSLLARRTLSSIPFSRPHTICSGPVGGGAAVPGGFPAATHATATLGPTVAGKLPPFGGAVWWQPLHFQTRSRASGPLDGVGGGGGGVASAAATGSKADGEPLPFTAGGGEGGESAEKEERMQLYRALLFRRARVIGSVFGVGAMAALAVYVLPVPTLPCTNPNILSSQRVSTTSRDRQLLSST